MSGLVEPEAPMRAILHSTLLVCAVTAALTATPAQADSLGISPALPLDTRSELVVGLVNTCATSADVHVVIKDAATNTVLRRAHRTIAAKRGTVLTYHSGSVRYDLVVVTGKVTCQAATLQRPARFPLLISITVRDWETKVPRFGCFIGDTMEGNCI